MSKKDNLYFPYDLDDQIKNWKYKVELKQLGLPEIKKKFGKKFIAIQIDALPFAIVEKYLHTPHCKFLRKLITDNHYFISKFNCGLPSDTPTVTAGIFYGNSEAVAGFRIVDKKNKRMMTFADPEVAYETEQILKKKNPGILKEGSAFVSHYSAGAERSFLTMSTLTHKGRLKRLKESNIIMLMLLNPFILIKVAYTSLIELILELYDAIRTFFHRIFIVKEKKTRFKMIFPFKRLIYQGFVMEIQKIGAILDMNRGVPRIYLNFHAYDDLIHRRGMESTASLRVLRQIDRTIQKIYREKPEDYDIYIFSDHGAEDSTPFDKLYDESLENFLHTLTKAEVHKAQERADWPTRLRKGAVRMGNATSYLTGPVRWITKLILKAISKEFREKERAAPWKDKEQIFIMNVGGFAQVYFNISQKRMDLSQIKKKYPRLIKGLRNHPGIGFFVVKEKENTHLICWDSSITIMNRPVKGKVKIVSRKGRDFLKKYGKTDVLLKQLQSLTNRDHVGDIILFGNYHDGKMVSFGDYYAAHGGAGKQVQAPFFISEQGFDLTRVTSPDELYKIFKQYL